MIRELARGPLQTLYGEWTHILYWTGRDHAIAMTLGDVTGKSRLLCRVHSSCITAHVFMSTECDCREQLCLSMSAMQRDGLGVVVWLDQEGRGNGMMAHVLSQDTKRRGLTQSQAYEELNFPSDARDYWAAVEILRALGIQSVRIMTNNPEKVDELKAAGVPAVEGEERVTIPTDDNALLTKQYQDKISDGHHIELD